MFIKTRSVYMLLLSLVFTVYLSSCSRYQRLLKSTDTEKKYEKAVEYYNKKDYFRALPLFEELMSLYRGTQKAESTYYYYAYCHYGTGDYMTASYYFQNLAKTFPNGQYAEEASYMNAYCYYLISPVYSLDQTSTIRAINEFQLFINKYPESSRIQECNKFIDDLRLKLETKAFENAKLYYDMSNYKSAIVVFKNVLKDYPDTKYREDCLFLSVRSYYLLANNSIEEKRQERYKSCIDAYQKLIEFYPETKYLKEARSIYQNALKQIEKKKQSNSIIQ